MYLNLLFAFQVLASKLRKSKSVLLERIDIRSNLIVQFEKGLSEMDNSMHQEDRNKSEKEEQSTEKLIRYLIKGNYGDILQFLQLLEQTAQDHILNYIISDGGKYGFADWKITLLTCVLIEGPCVILIPLSGI